jgi:sortase A
MKKINGICCMIFGTVLIAAALLLVLYNFRQDNSAGIVAGEILAELKPEIQANAENVTEFDYESMTEYDLFSEYENNEPTTEKTYDSDESVIEIDGRYYIGVISIPSLDIELPVMREWSYPNLKISPCRYSGSAEDGNLIIAAHNYNSHFGKINELGDGDTITFTEIDGTVYEYEVVQNMIINGTDVSTMVYSSDSYDLTLFTCTLSGQSRVTVRAVRIS